MENRPGGALGVNDPTRKLHRREAEIAVRVNLLGPLAMRTGEQVVSDRGRIIKSWHHTTRLAEQLVEKWDWLMQTDPEVQGQIRKWRLNWQKAWKWSQYGVKGDTTLLPATWSRIANIIYNSPYHAPDLARQAAAMINLDVVNWDTVWTDLSSPGKQSPVNGTRCRVSRERRLNKPRRYRTQRSLKVEQYSWAATPMDAYVPFRYLRSKRPEEIPTSRNALSIPFAQTTKGRFGPGLIYKISSKHRANLARV